ncbi:coiled-coil domain-containing protein [Enterococcus faecium]|uniref:coiled-coil domain-containing protein n=1 Tax=Enterococcus faecium TaxID=1352 RepID=UPI000CF1E67B|nr:hypothetical protein [Enterococcus faecium]EGP4986326.1 hypothetical protein [Enterococcus faecium]PQE58043.1 hypothetical protein CUS10_14240 [Enterococcus faecium]
MDKILELKEKILDYREQVQSKSRSKSKLSKKVEKNSSRLYVFLFVLTIVGYLFFFFSRNIFVDDSPIIDSGTGTMSTQKIGDINVQVLSREINPSNHYGEFLFEVEGDQLNTNREFQAVVSEEKNKTQLKSKLMKIYDNYYVLQVETIPLDWKNLVVDFGYVETDLADFDLENSTKQKEKTLQTTFNFDYRKVKETNDLEKKSKQDYVIEMTQEQIEQTLKTRNKADKTIEELTEETKKIDQKIRENREEIEYKTGEEKEEYEQANQRLESQKQKYEDKIKEINETKKSLEEKRQKLIEKNREAQSEKTK